MNLEKLKEQICNIKDVHIEVIKAGVVFTLLLKGKGLSDWYTINKINLDCLDAVGEKYSIIEVAKNHDDFFLLVLR